VGENLTARVKRPYVGEDIEYPASLTENLYQNIGGNPATERKNRVQPEVCPFFRHDPAKLQRADSKHQHTTLLDVRRSMLDVPQKSE